MDLGFLGRRAQSHPVQPAAFYGGLEVGYLR